MSRRGRLVLALLAGPLAAATDMMLLYVLVYRARATGSKLSLHLASIVALGITVGATLYAVRESRREGPDDERFLAILGASLGAFFALVIVAFEVPTSILHASD